jgi:predicted RND superfamily exporter protein/lauroyl/myristoyl acyltransferase
LRHPGRWFWLVLLVPVIVGLIRLRFDVEVFDLLPPDLNVVKGLKLYEEHFANARELIITVKALRAEEAEAAAKTLAERLRRHPELVSTVTWEPPWLEHPEQAAELIAYLWFNQPPSSFRQLATDLTPDKLTTVLADTREELATSMSPQEIGRLSYDPFHLTRLPETAGAAAPAFSEGQELFSSSDGTFRLIFVQANRELRSYRECELWLNAVKGIAKAWRDSQRSLAEESLGFTGRPAFVTEIAKGMQHDMSISVAGTAGIIALLFWLAHKRIKPMLWLLTLLAAILASTLALGGLVFGAINVVSMGFAAILLGLAVDYAVVHYQEALAHPDLTIPQIRHAIAPSIFWAAVTTISAFLVLNVGGLPGLGQLGTLVALGVALAALIMIFEFLPPLFPGRDEPGTTAQGQTPKPPLEGSSTQRRPPGTAAGPSIASASRDNRISRVLAFAVTAVVLIGTLGVLAFGLPRIDPTADALRPRKSAAYAELAEIQTRFSHKKEPIWLILSGKSVETVANLLDEVQPVLADAVTNDWLSGFTLPAALWPKPEFQAKNRATARELAAERAVFGEVARTNGFAERSLALTERMLDTWQTASQAQGVFWPTNPMSQWLFEKLTARTSTNYLALGLISAAQPQSQNLVSLGRLEAQLPSRNVWLSGWQLLGHAIFARVNANLWKLLVPMLCLVFLSLLLAFRRVTEIALSLAALGLGGLCLLTVMRLVGWSWNLLNLMAVPLILGTGVDYSIFMQLALRRHAGDLNMAYVSVGRALLLCGGTAIAGFGSLALSSNAGMASLGQVCAVGVGSNMLIAIFLLPVWWKQLTERKLRNGPARSETNPYPHARLSTPSSLYRAEFWLLGQWIVRLLPQGICMRLSRWFAALYWKLGRHRRDVVVQNLLPPLGGDRPAAEKAAKALFQQFALKVVDLWRYEAGLSISRLFGPTEGWEYFEQAQSQKRGILLLTPHLGNWEFGGPLLTQRGVTLQVITLAEPGEKFTELRQASRARWNIETIVIRDDPLAFVEIIQKLEMGATVALLMDRPPGPTAVAVDLFGKPFPASIAAAELARASGCVLLPVYLPRNNGSYEAHILSPIPYDRAALRARAARQELTQRIMGVFEPLIREYLDQWYHFVPVWPEED